MKRYCVILVKRFTTLDMQESRRDRDSGHLKPSVNIEKLTATETKGDVVITYVKGTQRPPALEGLWGLKSALNLGLYKVNSGT
jgi:hypothetical protein